MVEYTPKNDSDGECWILVKHPRGENGISFGFGDMAAKERDAALERLMANGHTRRTLSMTHLKEYFIKYRDTLLTIGLVVVLDHFIFQGAFRSKIQKAVEKLLDGKVS